MAAASAYFKGPKPGVGGKAASLAANENPPKVALEPRTIKVRAHTRTLPAKKPAKTESVPLPPSLSPKTDMRFTLPKPAPVKAAPVRVAPVPSNTQYALPAARHGASQRFYHPLRPGQKPSGYEAVGRRPGRAGIGSPVTSRPYWLATRGAAGDQGAQLSSAQLATARQAGVHQTIPMTVLSSTVHPLTDLSRQAQGLRPFSVGGAASDVANIASALISPEKAGAAAGIFGLRGLRAARVAKKVVAAEDAAKAAEAAVPSGHVRLYRGEGTGAVTGVPDWMAANQGLWHTDDVAAAQRYAAARGGKVVYVDVPHSVAAGSRVGQLGTASEYVLPKSFAAKGRPLQTGGPPTSAEAQTALRGTFRGARTVRGKQEAGYSVERAKRVAAANVHLSNQALPPDERLRLAKSELKGELPKIDFQGMKVLDDDALTKLQTHILDHPHLMPFQKITASTALANAVAGKVPTKSELTLLEHVFGKETANSLGKIATHPFKDTLLSVLNVPRSLMASFDLSAPFRQGLMVSTRHPTIFARNFGSMVKAFGSEKVYRAAIDEIKARPTYPLMMEGKLSLTDLGRAVGEREEQFASNIAEKIPVAGRGVRASGRAYTGFLDKTRADVFDHLIQRAQTQGINVQDQKFLKDLGRYVNTATGRGPLGNLQGAAPALNAVFFSPRLMMSRLDAIFSPLTYRNADPFVRKEAIRSMLQLAGTASTLLALASQIPGAKVGMDPRSADWGKIRIGNTRLDIGGGFQQYLRLFAQIGSGIAISSTTGKRLSLTAGQFGKPTRLDLLLRFFEGKESPIASLATDYLRNSNQIGQKFSLKKEAVQRLIPLLAQDSYDLYNEKHGGMNGLMAALAGYGVGSVGFGMQTYGPRPSTAKTKPQTYFSGSRSGGGSPYFAPPSKLGGGGGYFATP